jgi:hypothetical protein
MNQPQPGGDGGERSGGDPTKEPEGGPEGARGLVTHAEVSNYLSQARAWLTSEWAISGELTPVGRNFTTQI